jgi:hypothetical protein
MLGFGVFDRWEEVGLTEEQEVETMPAGGSVSVNGASSDPAGADLLTTSEESPSPVRSTTASSWLDSPSPGLHSALWCTVLNRMCLEP